MFEGCIPLPAATLAHCKSGSHLTARGLGARGSWWNIRYRLETRHKWFGKAPPSNSGTSPPPFFRNHWQKVSRRKSEKRQLSKEKRERSSWGIQSVCPHCHLGSSWNTWRVYFVLGKLGKGILSSLESVTGRRRREVNLYSWPSEIHISPEPVIRFSYHS